MVYLLPLFSSLIWEVNHPPPTVQRHWSSLLFLFTSSTLCILIHLTECTFSPFINIFTKSTALVIQSSATPKLLSQVKCLTFPPTLGVFSIFFFFKTSELEQLYPYSLNDWLRKISKQYLGNYILSSEMVRAF